VSRSLKERVPFDARTAKSNFALVCSLKAGTTGAFGNGGDNLGDIPGKAVLGCTLSLAL
jgi:hypothetical protein